VRGQLTCDRIPRHAGTDEPNGACAYIWFRPGDLGPWFTSIVRHLAAVTVGYSAVDDELDALSAVRAQERS
jgi:hypothetical protein